MRLSDRASLSLDLLRAATASAVVLYHAAWLHMDAGMLWIFTPKVGHSAVIVFFVLSGFVITASTRPGSSALDYAIKRAARVYSVAVPALLFIIALSFISLWLGGSPGDAYELRKPIPYFGLHALFGGDLWSLGIGAFGIGPYWSLNYEVWYYVMFGIAFFATGLVRYALLAAVLLLVGPKIAFLFPIWLAGAVTYHLAERHALPPHRARIVAALSLCALLALDASAWDDALGVDAVFGIPLRFSQWFLGDYVRSIPTCCLVWALCSAEIAWPSWLARWGRRLAEVSFSLYLLHFPLMLFFRVALPGPLATLLAVAVAIGFGMIFEPQRHLLRRLLLSVIRPRLVRGT